MILDSGVDNTALGMLHCSVAAMATTDGCCCTILLPPAGDAAV